LVKTLVNEEQEAGYFRTQWNGKDNSGRRIASGVYFYRLSAGDYEKTRKMVFLR
jgi:flagellar hook assembly protein FlgD